MSSQMYCTIGSFSLFHSIMLTVRSRYLFRSRASDKQATRFQIFSHTANNFSSPNLVNFIISFLISWYDTKPYGLHIRTPKNMKKVFKAKKAVFVVYDEFLYGSLVVCTLRWWVVIKFNYVCMIDIFCGRKKVNSGFGGVDIVDGKS